MTEKLKAILEVEGLSSLLNKFNEQGVTDSILGDLTDADLKELGVDKLGERKRLLAAFGKSGGASASSVVEESSVQTSGGAPSKTASSPAEATKDSPWVNTMGMPFVPIPRFDTRFCIWPVRVQDYEAFCMDSSAKFPEIPFSQESDHPIVGVSWNDAIDFCVWLTGKERSESKIDDETVYRLPTDLEWSAAVGLPHEPEATPSERHLKAPGYPWGLRWPPPRDAGNYEHGRRDQLEIAASADGIEEGVRSDISYHNQTGMDRATDNRLMSWQRLVEEMRRVASRWTLEWTSIDEHEFTSPVGVFKPNELGLHDMGGNVWEWCMDDINVKLENAGNLDGSNLVIGSVSYNPSKLTKVARGGSFSRSPTDGLSCERLIEIGRVDGGNAKFGRLTIQNSEVYKLSYRHFGDADSSLELYEFGKLIPNEASLIPSGGFRVVLAKC